jgi:corrinoid protein of di/trimethylamine methyltransferase
MSHEKLVEDVRQAILNYDSEGAVKAAKDAISQKADPLKVLDAASEGIKIMGEKFHAQEIFLPQLTLAADAMVAVEKIVEENLPKGKLSHKKKIVFGTIEGDLHDIGKNIVSAMLTGAGFEVHDIGKDVPVATFIEKAKELQADVIGVSALMTTTMDGQRRLIDELKKTNMRKKFKVLIGGGCTTKEWAKKIGADGYGRDAKAAVDIALKTVGVKA